MCERRQKAGPGGSISCASEGSHGCFPGASVTRGDVSRPPLCCARCPERSGFRSRASTRQCTRDGQTLLLPPVFSPPKIRFFLPKCFPRRSTVLQQRGARPTGAAPFRRHFTQQSLTPLPLGRGSLGPPAPPESVPRATDVRGHCPRPPEPQGCPQLHLRAGDALQQFLHPRGVRVHTHLPRGF